MKTSSRIFCHALQSRKPLKAEVSDIEHAPFDGQVSYIVRTLIVSMNM
jgi:hypothetical protein